MKFTLFLIIFSTCKYNAFTFIPKFLSEQFRKYSNVFFVVVAFLQQIPGISPVGTMTTVIPLAFILLVSAIKEVYEDLGRQRDDVIVNNKKVLVLINDVWTVVKWKFVKVGDILRIEDDHVFPADMILISSSNSHGMAYIETSSLDGETNLKIRQAVQNTLHLTGVSQLSRLNAQIECQLPNKNVHEFTGRIRVEGIPCPIGVKEFLLRGACLKNTKWIVGVVIYTGKDSKLLQNSKTAPLKRSTIEGMCDRRILILLAVLILLAIISTIGSLLYNSLILSDAWYLGRKTGNAKEAKNWSEAALGIIWDLITFFLLYNNLVPISLTVTLEMDLLMYDERTDTPAHALTSNLNEELGQVKFVMSDKTGTLTQNIMKFKACWIEGESYGNDEDESFSDPKLKENLLDRHPTSEYIRDFLTIMSVCHTVVPIRSKDSTISYQASSPDETALVKGAAAIGYQFCFRDPIKITVKEFDEEVQYKILCLNEFNSDRKRMSILVRTRDNKYKLFVKGADNMIFERLSPNSDQEMVQKCQEQIKEYATKGYRTLCLAVKEIDAEHYEAWNQQYSQAATAIADREKKFEEFAEKIETDLRLVGISAIEDKLQDYVPETIRSLMNAGIRIWMLTGDKRETAINIAQSSALILNKTTLLILDNQSYEETLDKLEAFVVTTGQNMEHESEFCLVIGGDTLHHALVNDAKPLFSKLCMRCRSVVCCRMTPLQKAEIVEMIKTFGKHIVLAIGDGANDAANVGIGITGEEGMRAASSADYSIAQFHFLRRLLLVHGTWNLNRSSKVMLFSFYKNITLYLIEMWFAFFSAFSGQTLFERWCIALFNLIFTSWPPIILGLFDRPLPDKILIKHPRLYQEFQRTSFSASNFVFWIFLSIWHSLLLFFFSYIFVGQEIIWKNGRVGGLLVLGNACYSYTITTVCIKSIIECDTWNGVQFFFSIGSIAACCYQWFSIYGGEFSGSIILFYSPIFWLGLLFVPLWVLLFDLILKGVQTTFFPSAQTKMILLHRPTKYNVYCKECGWL